ncbi:MAG: voltage-gated sodium channel [Rhodobacter sp. CACIA14H1]|nr:MAG: voltage-gated sodium channel [Rhodobacter sp. CACIA14H1]
MTLRDRLADVLESTKFNNLILGVILFNAILMGMETSDIIMAHASGAVHVLDKICLVIFVVELLAKLFTYGLRFFRSGWNVFDMIIIGIALLPDSQGLSVLRGLRVLRVLRVVSIAPSLRRVVEGLLKALPGMASVFLLMGILFYIAAVMATQLYGDEFPDRFGDLAGSALTLFQVMTMEGWADGVVRPVMEIHPYAWLFFIPFIFATSFAVMNLLVGLIVNSMQEVAEADMKKFEVDQHDQVMARLAAIEEKLEKLAK